jgi:hypothetical protein
VDSGSSAVLGVFQLLYSTAAYPNNFLYLLLQLHRIIVVGAATPIFNYAHITINQASVGNSEMDMPSHTAQTTTRQTLGECFCFVVFLILQYQTTSTTANRHHLHHHQKT